MTDSETTAKRARRRATRVQGPAELAADADRTSVATAAKPTAAEQTTAAQPSTERPASAPTPERPEPATSTRPVTEPAPEVGPAGGATAVTLDKATDAEAAAPAPQRRRLWRWVGAGVAALVVAGLVAGVVLLLSAPSADDEQAHREAFVQTARQGVLNLTTIHYPTAPEDVQHLLDGASGPFAQDFGGRKASYIEVVQKAQVNSDGKIISSGLEKLDGDTAVVLVASTAKVSNSAAPQPEDRSYRLRVTVTEDAGRMTVSNVDFVP